MSRFLAGRQTLSAEIVLKMAAELGVEGRSLDRVINDVVPAAAIRRVSGEAPAIDAPPPTDESRSRVRLMKFFFHPRTPLVYEVLKILGRVDAAGLRRALKPRWCPPDDELRQCLGSLADLGLVVADDAGRYAVVNASQDIVIPAKHTTDVGRRVLTDAIATHQALLKSEVGKGTLFMRSILASLKLPASDRAIDAVAPILLRLRDDVLALQSDEDDAVVHLLLSAVEVARMPRRF